MVNFTYVSNEVLTPVALCDQCGQVIHDADLAYVVFFPEDRDSFETLVCNVRCLNARVSGMAYHTRRECASINFGVVLRGLLASATSEKAAAMREHPAARPTG